MLTTAEIRFLKRILRSYDSKNEEITSEIEAVVNTVNALSKAPVSGGVSSYNDLADKPIIPADVSDLTDAGGLLGGSFAGTMDDITDGSTYVKTENNLTDGLLAQIGQGGLTQAQIRRLL